MRADMLYMFKTKDLCVDFIAHLQNECIDWKRAENKIYLVCIEGLFWSMTEKAHILIGMYLIHKGA